MPAIYRWDGTNTPTKVAGTDQLSLVELTDMNDVAISSPTNGQALVYNSTSQKWENGQGGSVIDELNDIGDVNITNPTDRQSLVYDYQNGEWVNGDAASADYSFDTVAEMLAAIAGGTVEDGATIYVDEDSDDEWRFIPISYADFMALPEAQRENGRYLVTGMSPMVNAYSVAYKNGKSVGQELDWAVRLMRIARTETITVSNQSSVQITVSYTIPDGYRPLLCFYITNSRATSLHPINQIIYMPTQSATQFKQGIFNNTGTSITNAETTFIYAMLLARTDMSIIG